MKQNWIRYLLMGGLLLILVGCHEAEEKKPSTQRSQVKDTAQQDAGARELTETQSQRWQAISYPKLGLIQAKQVVQSKTTQGQLLATVGIQVFDENHQPLDGATILVNNEAIGASGSQEEGITGYFRYRLSEGEYQFQALHEGRIGSTTRFIKALSTQNIDLILDQALAAPPTTLSGQQYALDLINWNGSSHQVGAPTRVGGYSRGPGTPYDSETLAFFDLSQHQGTLQSATLRIHINGGIIGQPHPLHLYEQDRGVWNPEEVNYQHFQDTNSGWSFLLGSAVVDATQQYYDIQSPELTQLVQRWVDHPSLNQGVILAGNFFHWQFYVEIEQINLKLEWESL